MIHGRFQKSHFLWNEQGTKRYVHSLSQFFLLLLGFFSAQACAVSQGQKAKALLPLIAALPAQEQPPQKLGKPHQLVQRGEASWYGPQFNGKLTSSGEVFNQHKLTAAHPTLPKGSTVKVTNLDNGRSVNVRVNDRGPFVAGRIIDVSQKAAKILGMLKEGTTMVQVRVLSRPD
jgi:rare lipoprotein A